MQTTSGLSLSYVLLSLFLLCSKQVFGSVAALGPSRASSSESERSTITRAPNPPLLEQENTNTCTKLSSGIVVWTKCFVIVDTVRLTYWPTNNKYSYPATFYDTSLDYTFTSPSVYMIFNTIFATNSCGRLGGTTRDAIIAFDPTDVSTIVPYTNQQQTDRQSVSRLALDDLDRNCPKSVDTEFLATQRHPMNNTLNRCNPKLAFGNFLKDLGLPYWNHCNNKGNKDGIFDPPGAIPPLEGDIVQSITAMAVPAANPVTPASAGPTPQPRLASNTVAASSDPATYATEVSSASVRSPFASPAAGEYPSASPFMTNQAIDPVTAAAEPSLGAAQTPTAVIIGTQTAVLSGSPITVSSVVISLGAFGMAISTIGAATTKIVVVPTTQPGATSIAGTITGNVAASAIIVAPVSSGVISNIASITVIMGSTSNVTSTRTSNTRAVFTGCAVAAQGVGVMSAFITCMAVVLGFL